MEEIDAGDMGSRPDAAAHACPQPTIPFVIVGLALLALTIYGMAIVAIAVA